ncbi:MAG TPA: response regulator [Verrucomicrobiae bacterium]|nr:response regulator [Verrucomicrobiae bacterium]
MPKLVVISKNLSGLSHELGDGWTTIGRGDGNVFQILDASVSGRHCEVKCRGDELLVRDLLSTNGTFIDGKKIVEGAVKAGGTLRAGEIELRFESPAASSTAKAYSIKVPWGDSPAIQAAPEINTMAGTKPSGDNEPPNDNIRRHQILFVDDSLAFLETFGGLCEELSNRTWQVHTATTADKALAILKETTIDLVILDIGMPMVDGLQLLGLISRRYPGVKIAVMTGKPTETYRATCLANGAELFIEKPISNDGIKVVFNLLNDVVSWSHGEGFTGAMRHVGLQEVIQLECIGRHSSILEVRNAQMRGQIYIETGSVIHAATGDLHGEKAFQQLLQLKGGEFQVQPFKAPPQRTIYGSWEVLLMEAARANDEETEFFRRAAKTDNSAGHALGDNVVVVSTYDRDGKWLPTEGEKK